MKELLASFTSGSVASQNRQVIHVFGMTATVKASGADTAGAFCVIESTLPPHYRLVLPHWHTHKTEAFYVIDGALTFTRDDQTFIAQCGSFVLVPPRTVHLYWNSTAAPVTFLTFSTPGGLELYLAELATAFAERPYDAALAAAIATRYDQFSPAE